MTDIEKALQAAADERDKNVIFFRAEGWYPVRLQFGRHEIPDHIKLNHGTIRVESLDGEVLWQLS